MKVLHAALINKFYLKLYDLDSPKLTYNDVKMYAVSFLFAF